MLHDGPTRKLIGIVNVHTRVFCLSAGVLADHSTELQNKSTNINRCYTLETQKSKQYDHTTRHVTIKFFYVRYNP